MTTTRSGRDVFDPPGRRAEEERLADATFEDHLLVELADLGTLGRGDAVETTVGNGAAAGDSQQPSAGAGRELTGDAVPGDPRTKFGELIARVAAAEQVEKAGDHVVGDVGERVRTERHRR